MRPLSRSSAMSSKRYEIFHLTDFKCPIDIRKELCQNMYLTGGLAMIPNLKTRLLDHLERAFKSDPSLSPLSQSLNFLISSFKPNVTAWMGGSIFGHLKGIKATREILQSDWIQEKP